MKTKEHYTEEFINYLYRDIPEEDRHLYQPEITQSRAGFKAGFNLAEELFKPKWINVEEYTPEEDIPLFCKVVDIDIPEIIEYKVCKYYQGYWYGLSDREQRVEKWMKIPQ